MGLLSRLGIFLLLTAGAAYSQQAETNAPSSVVPPSPAATAPTDPFSDPVIQDIQARHQKGVEGDKQVVVDLVPYLEKLVQDHPDNQLIRAYLGSAYTLMSRDLFPGPGKLKYLKLGLQTMDAAVEAAPNDPAVRFIRAVNNFSMPAFVNRKDTARKDFALLVGELHDPAVAAGLNVETKQAIYYYAGIAAKQLHDPVAARDAWQTGLGLGANTALGVKIGAELAKLKS